jgi:hypothetical protein
MGGISGSTLRALCALLLLCGCSSPITHWQVAAVPQQGPEQVELPYKDGGALSVKRARLLALRGVVHNLAVAGRVRIDDLVLNNELGVNARAGRNDAGRSFIIVTLGMLEFLGDDVDQVAGVMAHEIGHLALNHGEQMKTDPRAKSQSVAFKQHLERKADEFGVRLAFSGGYDPEGVLRANRRIQERVKRARTPTLYVETHPSLLEREADIFRLVSELAAATRQSSALQLWTRIGLGVEQQASGLVVTRLGGKSWGTLQVGDYIVSLESPLRAPVARVDDVLQVVPSGAAEHSFRFAVMRRGVPAAAQFHWGLKR